VSQITCQRWREGRASYRPAREPIDPRRYGVELIAGDRPGLLSEVGKVLLAERVDVVTARIMTIGERAEDVFHVTDDRGRLLTEDARARLQQKLIETLDRRDGVQSA
jgi:[protein-PII] uridylyltransferase